MLQKSYDSQSASLVQERLNVSKFMQTREWVVISGRGALLRRGLFVGIENRNTSPIRIAFAPPLSTMPTQEKRMSISKKMLEFGQRASWIRKMFEEGVKMKAQYGADQVFDFSLGNPDLPPPP